MRSLTPKKFFSCILGAGLVYVFLAMLDLMFGVFRLWFFFGYWSFIFIIILIALDK